MNETVGVDEKFTEHYGERLGTVFTEVGIEVVVVQTSVRLEDVFDSVFTSSEVNPENGFEMRVSTRHGSAEFCGRGGWIFTLISTACLIGLLMSILIAGSLFGLDSVLEILHLVIEGWNL